MSATEASRSLSELLNRVAAGEEIEITRGGATVAMASAPAIEDGFAGDVAAIRKESGAPNVTLAVSTP